MFTQYTEEEIALLHKALATKKEISIKKVIQKKQREARYHDLSENNKKLVQILKSIHTFKGLDERLVLDVLKSPTFMKYDRADVIIDKTVNSKSFYYVLSGSVKKVYANSQGEIKNSIFGVGEVFNEISVLSNMQEQRIIYSNEDNTQIFRFMLNENLQINPAYGMIYSRIYQSIAIEIAKKYMTISQQ